MTTSFGRRSLTGAAAALLPAGAMIGSAQAQPANEVTFDRIRRTSTLRIAALPGELPYFQKDLTTGEWGGACIDMAKDIAKVFDAKLEYVEATYGTSVLDLQSNKVDLAFALNPTPQRALSIGFAHAAIVHPIGAVVRNGLNPTTWDDINKPDIRIVYDIGSLHEVVAKRYCPKAQLTGYQTRDQCTLAMSSGRADVHVLAAILGLAALGKNPQLGHYAMLTNPLVALPSCIAIQREPDTRFMDVINAWIDFNRGTAQIREWLLDGLGKFGVSRDQIPASLSF